MQPPPRLPGPFLVLMLWVHVAHAYKPSIYVQEHAAGAVLCHHELVCRIHGLPLSSTNL